MSAFDDALVARAARIGQDAISEADPLREPSWAALGRTDRERALEGARAAIAAPSLAAACAMVEGPSSQAFVAVARAVAASYPARPAASRPAAHGCGGTGFALALAMIALTGCAEAQSLGASVAEQRRTANDLQARATMASICDIGLGAYFRELNEAERRFAALVCGDDPTDAAAALPMLEAERSW